ncbi:MAG: protein kinase, partial [Planctomycetales bacterium]|nr:protein kinase [Planctomycetales bacterium]
MLVMEPQRCPRREELAGYAAGTLHSEIADTIADHVDSCAQCDDTLAVLESSQAAVFPHLRQPPPEDSYAVEQQCARAVALVEQIGRDPSFSTQQKIDDGAAAADYPELIGAYQLLEKLGEGGMGAVYKAVHTKLRKVVALKLLPQRRTSDPQSIARFEREMRAVGALDHPLIVRAMDAGEADGVHYLVMEYIDGVDLSRLVREIGPLPWRQAVECVLQAARALAYAHGQGVVHRDIKPSNLVL